MNQRLFQVFTLPPAEQRETRIGGGMGQGGPVARSSPLDEGRKRGQGTGGSGHGDHGRVYISNKTQSQTEAPFTG